jgi:hypothetical protein
MSTTFTYNNTHGPLQYATAVPVPLKHEAEKKRNNSENTLSFTSLTNHINCKPISETDINRLKSQGFTSGLAEALSQNNLAFPLRVWVIDNSGSMNADDGHRIIPQSSKNDLKFVSCTRWAEIKDTVEYHSQLSMLRNAPTVFRLLNHPGVNVGTQQFVIAEKSYCSPSESIVDVQNASHIMNRVRPSGATPLIDRLIEIHDAVTEITPQLVNSGQKVALIIATDGLPTIGGRHNSTVRNQFVETLRMFEGLPVWMVIRLCTDEDDVVEFYNELDEQLELSLEVLDDFVGEAKEVYSCNNWLNYALPLHRLRECGHHDKVFDMLDERKLSKGELRDFCELLFGQSHFDGCDPEADWKGFLNVVTRLLESEDEHYNPIKKRPTPWIDTKKLNKMYGKRKNLFGF